MTSDPGRTVLVVDAANVIGAVPDGWWRDRAGAAARLHAALVAAPLPYDDVILVLEGRARPGAPEGCAGRVRTIHAPGLGDDELVAQCRSRTLAGDTVTLATADRGLVARVAPLGVAVTGPRGIPRT